MSLRQLNIRNVSVELRQWIEIEKAAMSVSQNEFILSTLNRARNAAQTLPLPFELPPRLTKQSVGKIPFSFVDLFAGIGGFRIALEEHGGSCVFTSEWDKYSQKTYKEWFGEMPHGDITKILPGDIPDHDILAAGFPCQPFSLAGVSKKNSLGRLHGFKCATQGTLFFNIATIVEVKRPPVLLLENVKNIQSHDQGRTWQVILDTLQELNYWVFADVIDAVDWVPQHRERVYIVCFDKKVFQAKPAFKFPGQPSGKKPKLRDILEENPLGKYTLSDHLWNYLQRYAERHREKGNGFGFGLAGLDQTTRTLSARYHKDGSEILIPQRNKNPRRLTPRECAKLMGFPEGLPIVVSDTQAYRQFGNAVVPKVAAAVVERIVPIIEQQFVQSNRGCLLKRSQSSSSLVSA